MSDQPKKRASDLKAIQGHKNYYRSSSGVIYYKDSTTPKFSTGESQIIRAKKVVDKKKLESQGLSKEKATLKVIGVSNSSIVYLWEKLIEEKKLESSPGTMRTYSVSWKHGLSDFWGEKNVLDLNDDNLTEFKMFYLVSKGDRFAARTVIHLGMFVRWCNKKGHLTKLPDLNILKNLDDIVAKNTKRKKVGRAYTDIEVRDMLSVSKTVHKIEHMCARIYLCILLGGKCGLRKESEILSLRWENIDISKRTMKVWSMKNHNWREIPLPMIVLEGFLWQRRFSKDSPWVFPMQSNRNRHISGQILDQSWVRVKKKAKIKGHNEKGEARFHDLRHTFASKTADEGWPPKVACSILDMSLDQYDKIYAKASMSKKSEMMEKTFGNLKNEGEV